MILLFLFGLLRNLPLRFDFYENWAHHQPLLRNHVWQWLPLLCRLCVIMLVVLCSSGFLPFLCFFFWLQHYCVLCFFPFAVAVMCALILCLQWDGWEKFFAFQIYSPGFKRARVWLVCVFWREWMYVCLCMFV